MKAIGRSSWALEAAERPVRLWKPKTTQHATVNEKFNKQILVGTGGP